MHTYVPATFDDLVNEGRKSTLVDHSMPRFSVCTRCLREVPTVYYTDGTYDSDLCVCEFGGES